ncbi:hypothetical protein BHE74_00031009 [Ensete ventricosum]|nr:hypothetical protein BHE74_00031009 [Ensete ventricosum]
MQHAREKSHEGFDHMEVQLRAIGSSTLWLESWTALELIFAREFDKSEDKAKRVTAATKDANENRVDANLAT